MAKRFEDVLEFWFPQHLTENHASMVRQFEWWFRGGADEEIKKRFVPLFERAVKDELRNRNLRGTSVLGDAGQ